LRLQRKHQCLRIDEAQPAAGHGRQNDVAAKPLESTSIGGFDASCRAILCSIPVSGCKTWQLIVTTGVLSALEEHTQGKAGKKANFFFVFPFKTTIRTRLYS
jgi:hypothetical protein